MNETKLFIEVMPDRSVSGRQTYTTNFSSSVLQMIEFDTELYDELKQKIEQLSQIFFDKISADEIEFEFSFGVTANGNICILSGSSSFGMKVILKWKAKKNTSD